MADPPPSGADVLERSGRFDPAWYASAYPDVEATGVTPAEHWLWLGARLGRSPLSPEVLDGAARSSGDAEPATDRLDALLIDGTGGTTSTSYRVRHIADGLAAEDWAVRTLSADELRGLLEPDASVPALRYAIVHRARFDPAFGALITRLRAAGAVIVFDLDDLVFDDALLGAIDAFSHLGAQQQNDFRDYVREIRAFVLEADLCTASTMPLVNALRALGKPAFRVRNSLSAANLDAFGPVRRRGERRPRPFVVGYYPGTKTHQADFAAVAPALVEFMDTHEDVMFRLVGALDLSAFPDLARWEHPPRPGASPRITRVGLMPHDVMLRDQWCCDLLLAPLEVGNPFCEGKSELKFFEAALVRCPVIASPTAPFRDATREGTLALLANTSTEWLAALHRVYNDYPAALARAEHAFAVVSADFSQAAAAAEARAAYAQFDRWRADHARRRLALAP